MIALELPVNEKRIPAQVQMAARRSQVPLVARGLRLGTPSASGEFKGSESSQLKSGERHLWRRLDKPDGVSSGISVAGETGEIASGAEADPTKTVNFCEHGFFMGL